MELPKPIGREFITRSEILAAGGNDRDIRAARRAGEIVRLRHGAYTEARAWQNLRPEERHRVLTHVVLDRLGDGFAATHTSAAAEHNIALYGHDLTVVHVTHRSGGCGRRENGIVFHTGPITDDALVDKDGRHYSAPTRALWETAMIGGVESSVVSLDWALRLRLSSKEALREAGGQFASWSGSRNARLAMSLCDGRSGSVGESRSRYKFYRHGIPAPELQYEIRKSNGILIAYTDFAWLRQRHIGEFDGKLKYDIKSEWVEDPKSELLKEKGREDNVREELWGVSRWGWVDLDPPRLAPWLNGLRFKLDQSERLYGRNAVHIPLS